LVFVEQSSEALRALDPVRRGGRWTARTLEGLPAYRVFEVNQAWLAAILAVAAERCVWGSDWPHTPPHALHTDSASARPYRALSYARLVDDFIGAVGSSALAERIMRDNPARLYGF